MVIIIIIIVIIKVKLLELTRHGPAYPLRNGTT